MTDKCPLCGGTYINTGCCALCGLPLQYWEKIAEMKRRIEELEKEIRNLKPKRKG